MATESLVVGHVISSSDVTLLCLMLRLSAGLLISDA